VEKEGQTRHLRETTGLECDEAIPGKIARSLDTSGVGIRATITITVLAACHQL
jgi:hypothetical protein